MLRDGVYRIVYINRDADVVLATLRNGKIFASDAHGGVYTGAKLTGPGPASATVRLILTIPPGGQLVTGFTAGLQGAEIEIVSVFDPSSEVPVAVADLGGRYVGIELFYLGPLPN